MCSKQDPRQLLKETGAIHWSSQLERDWQTDYFDPLPLGESSKYAWICVDTVSGLTQAFPCHFANQDATIRGLEKLINPYQIDSVWGLHFKGHLLIHFKRTLH